MRQLRPNHCGTCTACCDTESVHEIGKPSYSVCEHVCSGGCGIYQDRPQSCRDYTCCFLAGLLGNDSDKWRPDNCGLLFSMTPDPRTGKYDLWVYETRANAGDKERIKYIAGKIAQKFGRAPDHVLFHYYGTKVGVTFKVDQQKYSENAEVEGKYNQFDIDKEGFGICLGLVEIGTNPTTRTETQFCKR
jgi:hypothetical protein